MKKSGLVLAAVVAAGGAVVAAGFRDRLPAQGKAAPPPATVPAGAAQPPTQPTAAEEGIKAITAEYAKAFNAADAQAAAALWTADGEYVGADGVASRGRPAVEKSLAEFFKNHPKATAEIKVVAVRPLGRQTAAAEGVVTVTVPGEEVPVESRYSALHVLEDGKWHAATVREWVPDPATAVTPGNLEWLVGEWAAKGDAGEMKVTYAWDETKTFLTGKYTITTGGKPAVSGTHVIGQNPAGGLRSWTFDSSGTTSEAVWVRDGKRWVNEAVGMLPAGVEVASVNVLIQLGPDAFTWQTTERAADGVPLPALPPLKVTRVKK